MSSSDELTARDRRVVLHPYAPPGTPGPLYAVSHTEGTRIWLEDGSALIDGMSSWWAAIHGYNHPALVAAMGKQLATMSHVMFGGLTHEPAVALCERLVALTPAPLTRVFLSDSGSVSVEVALKLAIQYQHARGKPRKTKFLTPLGGYHGDTLGAMSVCDPVNGMHTLFQGLLPQQIFAPLPGPGYHAQWESHAIDALEPILHARAHEIAAVILEPVVQNAGGLRFHHPEYLRQLRGLCDQHDVLLIFDEIATGFGRTGRLFGAEHAGVAPDVMCVGKALTGGMLTLAATLITDAIADAIAGGEPGVFMHGPTYMGNPLACAAALANLELLFSYDLRARIAEIEQQLWRELSPLASHPSVHDVRVLGAIGVVELKERVDLARMTPRLVERGVWLRPFGKLLYTMPPYIVSADELRRITDAMAAVL